MIETKVHDLLSCAAFDAEEAYTYNFNKPNHMRISRAGLPLVSMLLEDFVFPSLPEPPKKQMTERKLNAETIKHQMALSSGYVFEQVIVGILKNNQKLIVKPQYKVNTGVLSGTADIITINESEARVTVVECKALKWSTKKEACLNSLFNDNSTGYLTQLALYKHALEQQYTGSGYKVDACWMVFCKASANTFKVPFNKTPDELSTLVKAAEDKVYKYNLFKQKFSDKDLNSCLSMLDVSTLPLKDSMYSSFVASCPAHYNDWIDLLVDESGLPWEETYDHLTLMLEAAILDSEQAKETLLNIF